MSKIYKALEKVEREKEERSKTGLSLKDFVEKGVSRKEDPPLRYPAERRVELGPPSRDEDSVLMAPPSSFAEEQFRKLKTQIFHWSPNPPHILLVTSTLPGEGKTVVSVNLALAISQEIHKKAILVDADLRKPSIHLESQRHSKGLSSYLLGQTHSSEILVNSDIENLWFVPAGPSPKKSAELIGTTRMKELLTSLREFGDDTYVIIDSSPILATAEPTLLSKMVEGVILVVMADRTPRAIIRRAIQLIDRQKIVGIVFNQKDLRPLGRYSSYYHGYHGYYRK
jgi:capsular exopolysaccharide synthesis family protein